MLEGTLLEQIGTSVCTRLIQVMHVDDDFAFLSLAKQCLEIQADIEVESFQSVDDAIAALKNREFDVIVSDYQMPKKDGLEFLREVKALGITTPFILFTGKGRDEAAVKALESGAFRYIDKRGAPEATFAELASCIHQATQYTRTRQLLNESENRFRAIFDSSIDAILVLNDSGEIIYSNKAAKLMLNYAKNQITKALNRHFSKQFTAIYEQNMHKGFWRLPEGNLSMTGETVELAIKKGETEPATVELSFSAFAEKGQWYGVSIVRDISERKKQEQLLEESRQTLKALFSYNPEAIVFMDKSFQIVEINPSFTNLFGFTLEEIKGKNIETIVPEGFEKQAKNIEKVISKEKVSVKTKRKRRDGVVLDVGLSGGPLLVNGKLSGYFMVFVDISDLVFVQETMLSALKNSQLLNEKIKVLGGFTRHDVRNKLALIQGNLYLARSKCKIEPTIEKYLKVIDGSVDNICKILDFAKAYEMIGVEQLVPVNVGKMINNAVSLFSDLQGVNFENQCMGFEVIADSLLTQVFYNLIDNSLKYGVRTRNIRIFAKKKDEHSVKLFYRDDGVGVDDQFRKHLFEKGCGKGSGYGLYLTRSIANVYGWQVEENGNAGEGAQFEFTIPVERVRSLR